MSEVDPFRLSQRSSRTPSELSVPERVAAEALPVPHGRGHGTAHNEGLVTPHPGLASTPDDRNGFVEFVHHYIREYTRLADQKAAFFFAGSTALLAFLYRNDISERWLKPVMQWNIVDVLAFVAMVALAIGVFCAVLVVIPRRRGSRRSHIFWEGIAEYDNARDYADSIAILSPATLTQMKAEHCFELASVCRRKYRMLVWSLWICATGLFAALVVIVFGA